MPLPDFNKFGDLPPSVHQATLDEVIARFGQTSLQRQLVTKRWLRIFELAKGTGYLERFVIFGSYVTAKPNPNDVDIILVMQDDFIGKEKSPPIAALCDHTQAQLQFGASVFWTCPSGVLLGTVEEFIAGWQIKREGDRRGIVEVVWEEEQ